MGDDVPITSRGVKYTASLKVEIDSRKQMDWPSLWRRRLLQKRFLVFWWTEGYKKLGRRRHFGAPPSSCHGQSSWCLKRDRPKRQTPSCFNWELYTSESCEWSGRWGKAECPDFQTDNLWRGLDCCFLLALGLRFQ